MPKFRKKPIIIEATQWFKNGDHPEDYSKDVLGFEKGEMRIFPGEERRANGWEGSVVRYFRRPELEYESSLIHPKCGNVWHGHGWIDTPEGGHIVCPGDWIITGVQGEYYPCKSEIFQLTYEEVKENK